MSQAIVRTQTPEEREYAEYLAKIEVRNRHVASVQAELETLTLTLGRFEAEYHARVGTLFVELDRARLAVDEYERRIARLHADPKADPTVVEQEIHQDFSSQREEVRQEEAENRRYEQAFEREQARPRLARDAEEELKRLYRDLAKRYHPDLARSEEEHRLREPVMQRVNAAMRERNLEALRALIQEAEVADPAFDARSLGEKLVWAIREIARLDQLIAGLEADLAAARSSETHQLWHRHEAGEHVIETLELDLKTEISSVRDRLAELIATYRQLIERKAP